MIDLPLWIPLTLAVLILMAAARLYRRVRRLQRAHAKITAPVTCGLTEATQLRLLGHGIADASPWKRWTR